MCSTGWLQHQGVKCDTLGGSSIRGWLQHQGVKFAQLVGSSMRGWVLVSVGFSLCSWLTVFDFIWEITHVPTSPDERTDFRQGELCGNARCCPF